MLVLNTRVCAVAPQLFKMGLIGSSCMDNLRLFGLKLWSLQLCMVQYNTSWGTETPPGTSLQAYFVAHGRSNIVRNNLLGTLSSLRYEDLWALCVYLPLAVFLPWP